MYDLVIKNGRLITAESQFIADIGMVGEQIAAVGSDLSGQREIDASGKLVTPGAVDMHVHLQMPIGDFVSADTFFSGTQAAAVGGTTAVVDFVETRPDQTMVDALAERRALADPQVAIDYGLHMTIGPEDMAKLDQVPDAFAAGCGSFKLYMAYGLRLQDHELLRALSAIAAVDGLAVIHAENWDVICELVAQNVAAGRTEPRWHPRSRPAIMEGEATGRVLAIAALAGARAHIFHVSCGEAVDQIAAARAAGFAVSAETCPQYLLTTWEAFEAPGVEGALPVCSPPIREQAQQDALWAALGRGDLQVVATDHCPFTRAEKQTGLDANDYSRIPGGVGSIESRFAALFTAGVRTGRITPEQWVAACCTTPAEVAGFTRKGRILPGYDADLVVFDPEREVTISAETLHERADWSLYEGMALQGWPSHTISRGRLLVDDGDFVGEAGLGRFVPR